MSETPIERSIRLAGGAGSLAAIVKRSRRQVFNVKKRAGGLVPVDWCPAISARFGVPLHELNPEAFPSP